MNLVTKENLFITGFILVIVLGVQYIIYLQLKKYTVKEIMKKLYHINQPINKLTNQPINKLTNKLTNQPINKLTNQLINKPTNQTQSKKQIVENDDDNDNDNDNNDNNNNDMDSNIDSYVNPLPSVNNNDDDNNDD